MQSLMALVRLLRWRGELGRGKALRDVPRSLGAWRCRCSAWSVRAGDVFAFGMLKGASAPRKGAVEEYRVALSAWVWALVDVSGVCSHALLKLFSPSCWQGEREEVAEGRSLPHALQASPPHANQPKSSNHGHACMGSKSSAASALGSSSE